MTRRSRCRFMIAVAALCLTVTCGRPSTHTLDTATTTSVQNSGLLNQLLPAFERTGGLEVRVHAVGSGLALNMLAHRQVDAVISHAPETERRMLSQHADWSYRKIAYNRFVLAGPPDDPAHTSAATDVLQAFRLIADSGATFVSRGDESGTHERERMFWRAAGRRPSDERVIVSGSGMAQALWHANAAGAYVLTDAPTFWQLAPTLDLRIHFENDSRLLNTYAVIHRASSREGAAFAAWLTSASGAAAIGSLTIDSRRAYEPWPANCAGGQPEDAACP